MKVYKSYEGQNILDFIQSAYGDTSYVLDFLRLNNINYNDFIGGNTYLIDDSVTNSIKNYYRLKKLNVATGTNESFLFRTGDFNLDYNNDYFNQDIIISPTAQTTYFYDFTGTTPASTDPSLKINISSFQTINRDPLIEPYWNAGFAPYYYNSLNKYALRLYSSTNPLNTNYPNAYVTKSSMLREGETYRVTFELLGQSNGEYFVSTKLNGGSIEGYNKFTFNASGSFETKAFDFICQQDSNIFNFNVNYTNNYLYIFSIVIKKL